MAESIRWAHRGDVIETSVQHPYPRKLAVKLDTAAACAYGNELIAAGTWSVHDWCDDAKCLICHARRENATNIG